MYVVEKILEKKEEEGNTLYKIKWKGWPMSSCTWEPVENLENIPEMLSRFEKGISEEEPKKKRGRPPRGFTKEKLNETGLEQKELKKRGRPKGSLNKNKKSFLPDVIALTEKETTDEMEVNMPEEKALELFQSERESQIDQYHTIYEPTKTFQDIISFDIPELVLSSKKINEQIFFFCRFKERNDGSRLEDSYVDCQTMETYFPSLLFSFYKATIFSK